VDDGSTDGSSKWISEFNSDITLLKGNGCLWWSGSVNMGLMHIIDKDFTHVLLFNNDNLLDIDFFKILHDAIKSLGYDKIISSKVINLFPERYVIYGGITFCRSRSKYIVNDDSDKAAVVNTAGGMGVLIPLSVINKVGIFDDANFPQKSGDTDFFLRSEKMGITVNYCPELTVYNDNRISGQSDNTSFQGILRAYSFPKGYMNLKVDLKLFLRHGHFYWSVFEITKKNVIFLAIGLLKIVLNACRGLSSIRFFGNSK
jgi:GT2 family glycosyltransferase